MSSTRVVLVRNRPAGNGSARREQAETEDVPASGDGREAWRGSSGRMRGSRGVRMIADITTITNAIIKMCTQS